MTYESFVVDKPIILIDGRVLIPHYRASVSLTQMV